MDILNLYLSEKSKSPDFWKGEFGEHDRVC